LFLQSIIPKSTISNKKSHKVAPLHLGTSSNTAALTHSERNPGRKGKMLRLCNPTGKLCYGNAGTNFLLSAPDVTEFLAQQPPGGKLTNIIRRLITASTDEVKSSTISHT
jgi:hypothetical protein